MKNLTPRDLKIAVIITTIVTALITIALLDRSCRRRSDVPGTEPSHSVSPH